MSKSKLRGAVGYTCYTRPSLQCTSLSCLKPGKVSNEQGSYVPVGYKQPQPRAATAPLGATRTTTVNMSVELGDEEQYMNLDRPNPDHDCRAAAREHGLPRPQDVSHWRSTHRNDLQGDYGPKSPQAVDPHTRRAELSPIAGEESQSETPCKGVKELVQNIGQKKGLGSHIQLLVKRPWTHHMGSRPRLGSRQGRMEMRGCHKGEVSGTSQGTQAQIPGYGGFMPASEINTLATTQADGLVTRPDSKDSLFASFRKVLPGYRGFQPASVHNCRSFETADGTTYGAGNASMTQYCKDSGGLSRPQAAGESLIIKEMFTAPLVGRPSDNGLANAQLFYRDTRPYEGLPRVHYPNARHQVGMRFPANSVSSMKDSGANMTRGIKCA